MLAFFKRSRLIKKTRFIPLLQKATFHSFFMLDGISSWFQVQTEKLRSCGKSLASRAHIYEKSRIKTLTSFFKMPKQHLQKADKTQTKSNK